MKKDDLFSLDACANFIGISLQLLCLDLTRKKIFFAQQGRYMPRFEYVRKKLFFIDYQKDSSGMIDAEKTKVFVTPLGLSFIYEQCRKITSRSANNDMAADQPIQAAEQQELPDLKNTVDGRQQVLSLAASLTTH